jgi:hypothetical protein
MANASIGVIHSKFPPSRTKRKHQTTNNNNDAPTIESSSITDQFVSSANAHPCSPLKKQEIDVDNTSGRVVVSPLKDVDSDSDSCSSNNSTADTIAQQREEGQQKLRELVINGASSGSIDWKSIISLAEDLHRKEQRLLNSYKNSHSKGTPSMGSGVNEYTSIGRRNISRKQAFFELRSKRRENARRKKLESVGSFSVNLLLYGADECTNYCGESLSQRKESDDDGFDCDDECQIDIYEDEEVSLSSQSNKPQSDHPAVKAKPSGPSSDQGHPSSFDIVEGSFLAATSLYSLSQQDEDESSESSGSTISYSGIEMEKLQSWDDEDGLITIHEDASVSLW